jgi:hypothetical protein
MNLIFRSYLSWRYSVVAITTDSDLETFSVNPGSNPGSAFFFASDFACITHICNQGPSAEAYMTFGQLISPMATRVPRTIIWTAVATRHTYISLLHTQNLFNPSLAESNYASSVSAFLLTNIVSVSLS